MKKNSISEGYKNPGIVLREIRAAKGWTLSDVHTRTGLAVSTLSKLETGKMEINYTKLLKLSEGLGLDIAELIARPLGSSTGAAPAPATPTGRRVITRKGEGPTMSDGPYGYELLGAELNQRHLHPMIIDLKARSLDEFGSLVRHQGEEFTYVLEGTVEFHSELYASTILNQGDSIYFDAEMGHAWIASSPGRCRILAVFTGGGRHPPTDRQTAISRGNGGPKLTKPRTTPTL